MNSCSVSSHFPILIHCKLQIFPWWNWIYMMTSWNGNIIRVTGPLCGEFTGPGEFPTQRPVTQSFDVFFDLRLNKRLSKQPWGWWFDTPSLSSWRQCNGIAVWKILAVIFNHLPIDGIKSRIFFSALFGYDGLNTLRPRRNGYVVDDTFQLIFLNENFSFFIQIWLGLVPQGPIYRELTML